MDTMIRREALKEGIMKAIVRGATYISDDVYKAFKEAIKIEGKESTRTCLEKTLKSLEISREIKSPCCPDTGWPIFYFKIGNEAQIEGGLMALEEATKECVEEATHKGYLRATMKHPLTGYDPGNNIGENIPHLTYKFVPGKDIQVTYCAKGGGSEVFGGTQYRMIAFADGLTGIKKFVVDSFISSARAGAICPPSVLGVGIGGTANIAANIAKEAACLRKIGSHHPDPQIAELEIELTEALNELGFGLMGAGGSTSVFSVNIEYAYTHIAGIAVATSSNCCVARRGTTKICHDNTIEIMDYPDWFDGR
ncbi:MAG TPA: fumarate hydratase [Clostridiaceae bacterium]|nr:fumarate hydratase [Clostridiaceae bacterium]